MPELPEVETVRRGLEQRTSGFRIARVEVRRNRAIASPADPGAFVAALENCSVGQWRRRGKYLIATVRRDDDSDGGHWGVHLRMTGQFLWLEEPREPCLHTRVRFWNPGGTELRFVDTRSFGEMWWVPPGVEPSTVITGLTRLGPEPFSSAFSTAHLQERLRGSSRPIKTALLDQALVAVLETSIGAGGTTFSDFRDLTGTNGNYGGQAWVYRRGGEPCRVCGTPIRRDRLSGRSTHWCPSCQS